MEVLPITNPQLLKYKLITSREWIKYWCLTLQTSEAFPSWFTSAFLGHQCWMDNHHQPMNQFSRFCPANYHALLTMFWGDEVVAHPVWYLSTSVKSTKTRSSPQWWSGAAQQPHITYSIRLLGLGYVVIGVPRPWVPISSTVTHMVYLYSFWVTYLAPKAFPSVWPGYDDKYRSWSYRFVERQQLCIKSQLQFRLTFRRRLQKNWSNRFAFRDHYGSFRSVTGDRNHQAFQYSSVKGKHLCTHVQVNTVYKSNTG